MIVHPIGSPAKDHIHHNSRSIMQKAPIGVRRRTRSKGTIAGFNTESSDPPPLTAENSSLDVSNHHPQHLLQGDAPPIPAKPSHNAKLALLCVQNANHMGARTQLHLCPPGKARDDLTKKLQEQRRRKKKALSVPNSIRRTGSFQRNSSVTSVKDDISVFEKLMGESGMKAYEDAEAEFLDNPTMHLRMMNEDGEECQEDPSSGDDDLLDFLFEEEKQNDDEQSLLEALYDGAAAQGQGSAKSGMLAFNFRKIKWFDSVTAADRAEAREYLKKELIGLKKRDALMLTSHLRKLQRREKRRLEIEQGRRTSKNLDDWDDGEDAAIGMNKLPENMTPSLAAALVLESLAMNPLESLEGMSKCYEGIVAAGSALLDMKEQSAGLKPTKKEIMNALTPLLITSLEQASGETILALSELRKMCGTKRYQRRFIQRIAPSLVRPPNAAMWCLRHQTDMKAILAATELIFESSSTIFSSDWFERGRSIVADAKRAESLNLAAMKLKKLSAPQQTENILSLTGSHHRRGNSLNMATPAKHSSQSGSGTEMLAEWEILAVDREIRNSIKTVFDRDWSRINIRHAPPREGESPYPSKKPRGHTYEKKRNPSPVPPPPTSETDSPSELLSPPRVRKEKASTAAENTQQSQMSPKRTTRESHKKSIHRSPKSRSKSQSKEELPSPPQTPTEQKSPVVHSPVRPSPNKDYASSEKIISPRPGQAPLSPVRTHHGINTNDTRTSSNSASASRAAQDTYLRNLTRTPADRKKTVAACRALRAQITRFENAFARVHGRPPKGAHERAPLATTYAQYREWKRAIRSDAASRIQSMYRGAHVRMMLKQNPTFRKIVEKRAGRPPKEPALPPPIMPNDIISQQTRSPRHPIPPLKPRGEKQDGSNGFGVEVVPYPADEQSLDYSEYTGISSHASSHVHYSPRTQEDSQNDLNYLTLPELSSLKRSLKQELKKYDMDFRAQYGRMPTKQEKEPIRSKYEKYNSLKHRISLVERDPSLILPKPQPKSQTPRAPKIMRQETPPSAAVPPPQGPDLQALKNEKQHLHQMLRSYERDFFRINNRQVSSYNDIKPVASQYRRYKEIKKSILAMQQQGQRR